MFLSLRISFKISIRIRTFESSQNFYFIFNFTSSSHLLLTALNNHPTSLALVHLICMQHLRPGVFALSSHRKLNVATDAIVESVRVRELNVPKLHAGNLCSWPNLWSSRLHKINSRASRKRLIRYRYFLYNRQIFYGLLLASNISSPLRSLRCAADLI